MTSDAARPEAPWIRAYFRKFAVRPGMYFEDNRARSVYLWALGYGWAREDLGLRRYGRGEEDLFEEFAGWLGQRTRLVDVEWIHHVEHLDPSKDNARTLFRLFQEFEEERSGR
ncbi:MAG: hypothetical protein RLP09_43205 [Sandaracinaceae bacterium]|nr:hypothetical protein [Myxococcales bacterium]